MAVKRIACTQFPSHPQQISHLLPPQLLAHFLCPLSPVSSCYPVSGRCLPPLNRRQQSQHQKIAPANAPTRIVFTRHAQTESARRAGCSALPCALNFPGLFSAFFTIPNPQLLCSLPKIGFVPSYSTLHPARPSHKNSRNTKDRTGQRSYQDSLLIEAGCSALPSALNFPGLFSASFTSQSATPLFSSKIGFVPSYSALHSRPPSHNNRSWCAAFAASSTSAPQRPLPILCDNPHRRCPDLTKLKKLGRASRTSATPGLAACASRGHDLSTSKAPKGALQERRHRVSEC
jgi:hypothetical protein